MEIKPGDIIFYPDDGHWKHSIFTWFQKISGEMGNIPEGKSFTHVGIICSEPDLMMSMTWPRPKINFFADDMREKIIMRPQCSDIEKMRAIYWCYFNINHHYSFLDMLLGKFGLKYSYKVCSAWVDKAYKTAGINLTSPSDKLISPNELYSSKMLVQV